MMRSKEMREEWEQTVMPAIPKDAETGWIPLQWRLAQTEGGNMYAQCKP